MRPNLVYQRRKIPDFSTYTNIQKKSNHKKKLNKNLQKTPHKKALDQIVSDPTIIGFPSQILISKEVFFNYKDQTKGEIDLIIKDYTTNINYYIEYKCRDAENRREKAKQQLNNIKDSLGEINPNKIKFLYIHGLFNIEELIENEWAPFRYPQE